METYDELINLLKSKREEIESLNKIKDKNKISYLKVDILNIINKLENEGAIDALNKMSSCDHVFVERVDMHTSRTIFKTMKSLNYKCVTRFCLKCGCSSININEFNYNEYHLNRYDKTVIVPSSNQRNICEKTMDYRTINCYKFKLASLIEKWKVLKNEYPDLDEESILDLYKDSIDENPMIKKEIRKESNTFYIRKLTRFDI